MAKRLKSQEMLDDLLPSLGEVPEHRTGRNTQYGIPDAGLGAFSVLYIQAPSFLAHQRDMQRKKGQNSAQCLFGVERIPSDGQIRNLLEPVEPAQLHEPFWEVYRCLNEGGHLDKYRGIGGTRLISLDGSQYFSSQEIHCSNCRGSVRDEKTYYSHLVMMAVVCAPEQEHVMHFLLTCKPESHETLYEELALLERVEGAISTKVVRKRNGRTHERWVYRWAECLPLRRGPQGSNGQLVRTDHPTCARPRYLCSWCRSATHAAWHRGHRLAPRCRRTRSRQCDGADPGGSSHFPQGI